MKIRGFKTKKVRFLRALKLHKVMSTQEVVTYKISRATLSRMAEAGEISSLGRGIYSDVSIDPFIGSVMAAARLHKTAVISNLTALVVHQLSDERIDRIDIDIDRTQIIRNKFFHAHRVTKNRRVGIIQMPFHGYKIRIYDRERTLCEAYHLDPGGALFFKALKRYLKIPNPDTKKISKYDQILNTKVLLHLRQELADA